MCKEKFVNENVTWKYLREDGCKSFDNKRHTKLSDYLSIIFPNYDFVYDSTVPKDIQIRRGSDKYKRYRPDARCEELSLVIEFDGFDHFCKYDLILKEIERDKYFKSLGYKVVRIPYFIQLSKENIKYLFGVYVDNDMCTLCFSFSDVGIGEYSFCLGSMSEAGRDKFLNIYKELPKKTQKEIIDDINTCIKISNIESRWVCPDYILESIVKTFNNK